MVNTRFWKNKRVLITGYNGFKGTWLTMLLLKLEAQLLGISLQNSQSRSFFDKLHVGNEILECNINLNDFESINTKIAEFQPEIIFHLAAEPLVLSAIDNPIKTWETNVLGTLKLLEASKNIKNNCAIIIVTSDKVYKNSDRLIHDENSQLGGDDPYSSSKASVELLIESWRSTNYIFSNYLKIASVRAGNVIGGGDFNSHRLIPDIIRAKRDNSKLVVRNLEAVRPWQYVLDPLNGYVLLAENLYNSKNKIYQSAFNFGPNIKNELTVLNVIQWFEKNYNCKIQIKKSNTTFRESKYLNIDSTKSNEILGWTTKMNVHQMLESTFEWYLNQPTEDNLFNFTMTYIKEFFCLDFKGS